MIILMPKQVVALAVVLAVLPCLALCETFNFTTTGNPDDVISAFISSKPPCQAGPQASFSRQAYSLALQRMTSQMTGSTQLALCFGMVIPCSGMLAAWRFNLARQATLNKTVLGVWRRETSVSARYVLVGSTPLRDPEDDKAAFIFPGFVRLSLTKRERFFVRYGDFIGIHYADDVQQATVAYLSNHDALAAGLPACDCAVLQNKQKQNVNREIAWTNGVTVLEGDSVIEHRAYALQADIEPSNIGEQCDVDNDCPFNAKCYTLSCTRKFCMCKPDYLPSQDGKKCRPALKPGQRCFAGISACLGELDLPASAYCSSKTERCECSQNYANRPPYNPKCRPVYDFKNDDRLANQSSLTLSALSKTYGLLGDDCSDGQDEIEVDEDGIEVISRAPPFAPCWKSRGLECRHRKCVCRHGYRPKTAVERSVYANSLDECLLETETAVGCVTTRMTRKPDPTTTTKPETTPKPECYSTYTCWLLEQKRQGLTTTEEVAVEVTNATTPVPTRRPTTTRPNLRIGERCFNETECPLNARCYPFTCENFICTCKIGYTPSGDYRFCLKEIDLGSQCILRNTNQAVCRGSLLLAGSVAECSKRRCECAAPYTSKTNLDYDDRPGYCRMAIDQNNYTMGTYGRLHDACGTKRRCYPPSSTVCVDGRCVCADGFREKLPLEYGYLPDRSSQCISKTYEIGCSKLLNLTTSRKPWSSTTLLSVTTTLVPPYIIDLSNTTLSSGTNGSNRSNATTTVANLQTPRTRGLPETTPQEDLETTEPEEYDEAPPIARFELPISTQRPTLPGPKSTRFIPSTTTFTMAPYPKPATISSLSYDGKASIKIWLPLAISVTVIALVAGVGSYLYIFKPDLFKKNQKQQKTKIAKPPPMIQTVHRAPAPAPPIRRPLPPQSATGQSVQRPHQPRATKNRAPPPPVATNLQPQRKRGTSRGRSRSPISHR